MRMKVQGLLVQVHFIEIHQVFAKKSNRSRMSSIIYLELKFHSVYGDMGRQKDPQEHQLCGIGFTTLFTQDGFQL